MEKEVKSTLPTLHQLAVVLDIPYARIANPQVAYKPQMGKPYTKDEINWDSIDAFITRRLEKTGFASIEDLKNAALEVDYTPKLRSRNPDSVWGKMLFGTTPVRKGSLKVGDKIRCKKTGIGGVVVFVNDTIVCYDPFVEGDVKEPTASIGNRVFNNTFEILDADGNSLEVKDDVAAGDAE